MTSRAALLEISQANPAYKLSRDIRTESRSLEAGTLRADEHGDFSFVAQSGSKTLEGTAGENALTVLQHEPPAVGFAVPSASVVLAGFSPSDEEYDAWMDLLDSERASRDRGPGQMPGSASTAPDALTVRLIEVDPGHVTTE